MRRVGWSVDPQRLYGVDLERAASRHVAGSGSHEYERKTYPQERDRIVSGNAEEQHAQKPRQRQRHDDADDDTDTRQLQTVADDQSRDVAAFRAERHADAELSHALAGGKTHDAIYTCCAE